jgi:hypothetical protein
VVKRGANLGRGLREGAVELKDGNEIGRNFIFLSLFKIK